MDTVINKTPDHELIEIWVTKSHVILKKKQHIGSLLWYSLMDGSLSINSAKPAIVTDIPTRLCTSHGFVGKLKLLPDSDCYLLFIKDVRIVGYLPPSGSSVLCIESIVLIPLSVEKSIAEIRIEAYANDRREKDVRDKTKLERKLQEALCQMFNGSQSFYFSYSTDLTQSLQRQHDCGDASKLKKWQQVDDRFFWNKFLLTDLIDNMESNLDGWILPIIQGFIEIKQVAIPSQNHLGVFEKYEKPVSLEKEEASTDITDNNEEATVPDEKLPTDEVDDYIYVLKSDYEDYGRDQDSVQDKSSSDIALYPQITMALVSRRSRHRAGTRYLRRGVDDHGNVANFVETEMILQVSTHVISYIIVRGSIPVYWSQPGNKYRPVPIIQQSESETAYAFERHFESQINIYGEQVLINLVNQSGREKIMSTAYENQLLMLDCSALTYVAFDFHHHCKLNQWQNINLLLDGIEEYVNRQKYFWMDAKGPLCVQYGVFRVNCMDCLDRTNVVQSVLCKETIQIALQKLGLLIPFETISGEFLQHYQSLWANNGDIISRQYTVLQGDITRYGHRRFYGYMRDGYNSAHRYIQSVFRDVYRQVVIDIQQGVSPQEALVELFTSKNGLEEEQFLRQSVFTNLPPLTSEREQAIADIINTCRNELYPNVSVLVKGWALVEPSGYSFVPSSDKDEDAVLLLCKERRHICVANYNSDYDQVACCIRVPLERIERITIGPIGTILRSSRRLHLRLKYTLFPGCTCYFTFRSISCHSIEEDKLTLLGIAEELTSVQPSIILQEQRLSKKTSQPHEGIVFLIAPSELNIDGWEDMFLPHKLKHDNQQSDKSGSKEEFITSPCGSSQDGTFSNKTCSAPSSPNLSKMISQEERTRLLSNVSLEELITTSGDDVLPSNSMESLALDSSSETDEDEIKIDEVLSIFRHHHLHLTLEDNTGDILTIPHHIPLLSAQDQTHTSQKALGFTNAAIFNEPDEDVSPLMRPRITASPTHLTKPLKQQQVNSIELSSTTIDQEEKIEKSGGNSSYLTRLKIGKKFFQKKQDVNNKKGRMDVTDSVPPTTVTSKDEMVRHKNESSLIQSTNEPSKFARSKTRFIII